MAELGLLAMPVPEAYGGMGASAVLTELAAEEIGRGDLSMATAVFFLLEAGWGWLLSRRGTEEAKREILPRSARGRRSSGSPRPNRPAGATSPRCGPGRARRRRVRPARREVVRFRRRGGEVPRGRAPHAHEGEASGFNFLYVPTRTPGISTQRFQNMGRMGISTGGLSYADARVPARYLLGTEGRGFELALEGFTVARTFVSAACIGAAERALETGMAYIRERTAFGQPLGKFEGIQFELVDLWTQVEAVKWQCRRAAWLLDTYTLKGDDSHRSEVERAVASVKLTAPPIAFECIKRVMMWFGAAGYTKDAGLELGLRGIMSYLVGAEGGLNIMRMILGRELLGREFLAYK